MSHANINIEGKLCMVTGATAGIGLVTARALAERGAQVVLVGRNQERGLAAATLIRRETGIEPEFMQADLSDRTAVRRLVLAYQSRHSRLDVLVNNAGAMFGQRQVSADGIEMTFALNHLGYFLLTNLLMPALRAAGRARIVNVASNAHHRIQLDFDDLQHVRRYDGWRAYKRSKLCNLLFTYELARRLGGTDITANALHPGFVATGIGVNNGWTSCVFWRALTLAAISPEEGAQTSIFLASSPEVEQITGRYFVKLKPTRSSGASYDQFAARRLWEVSATLSKLQDSEL